MTKLRGVNLGGWLVLERWMTEGLFAGTDAVDEYSFMQTAGAREKLREHQKNFIREADFQWMRSHGVNAVRIPVGYWVLEDDAPYVASVGRLDWAFRMAEKYDLQALLCLHGAPGSQNGQDHSGRVGKAMWYRSEQYRQQTLTILKKLAERYRDSPVFWGLELMNEPRLGVVQWKLRNFYNDAYEVLSAILTPATRIVFHDAFTPRLMSNAVWAQPSRPVTMDVHWYHFVFPPTRRLPLKWYFRVVISSHRRLIRKLSRWQGVVVGEWSGVIAGQTLRRYPRDQHESLQYEHIRRQLDAYTQADGWFYWSYKTEGRGIWNFRSLVEDGVIEEFDKN